MAREKKTEDPRPAPVFDSLATGHWPLATRCIEWRAAMAAGESVAAGIDAHLAGVTGQTLAGRA